MGAPASAWPALSGANTAPPANTSARILNAHHDVRTLLAHINSQTGHKVPAPVSNYLKIVEELIGDLLQNP
ncbi:hypothetical protein N7454_005259 [Penicillium verhagenii]|nr:hypothetical protein N7454_005259 [Penicillium verhagenii]